MHRAARAHLSPKIAHELNVDGIIEATVQRFG
jgi:hypothetical protein